MGIAPLAIAFPLTLFANELTGNPQWFGTFCLLALITYASFFFAILPFILLLRTLKKESHQSVVCAFVLGTEVPWMLCLFVLIDDSRFGEYELKLYFWLLVTGAVAAVVGSFAFRIGAGQLTAPIHD